MQAHFFMEQHHTHTHLHETVNFQHIHTYFISKFMLNFTLHLHSFFFQNACMGMVFGFQTTTTKNNNYPKNMWLYEFKKNRFS